MTKFRLKWIQLKRTPLFNITVFIGIMCNIFLMNTIDILYVVLPRKWKKTSVLHYILPSSRKCNAYLYYLATFITSWKCAYWECCEVWGYSVLLVKLDVVTSNTRDKMIIPVNWTKSCYIILHPMIEYSYLVLAMLFIQYFSRLEVAMVYI